MDEYKKCKNYQEFELKEVIVHAGKSIKVTNSGQLLYEKMFEKETNFKSVRACTWRDASGKECLAVLFT